MKLKLGSHVSFNKKNNYLVGAVKEAISYDANAFMIYLGPPQNTKRTSKEFLFLEEYEKHYLKIIPKENILVHAPYIINPANPQKYKFAIEFLIKEIKTMEYLGLKYLVLHPGAYTNFTYEIAIKTLIKTLKNVLIKTNNVEIHLELMSGKGTEIGTNMIELKSIIESVGSTRLGICFDTCHAWNAGYKINDFDLLINEFKKTKTLKLIKSLHINDSMTPYFHKKDRHANIGEGYIGIKNLKKIIHRKEFSELIKILETPLIKEMPPYKREIKLLKNLFNF